MKKILVTGGAGFIGSHLCSKLHSCGYEVTILDNLISQVHGTNPQKDSESYGRVGKIGKHIIGDANLEATWEPLFGTYFDAIVCLAAETGTGQSMMCAQKYCSTNIGTIALLNDLLVSGKVRTKKVILSSSRSVYGDALLTNTGIPIAAKEVDPTSPKSIYAVTKLCQEELLRTGFKNTPTVILRFQNVYGPGQSLKNPYTGIIPIFSTAIKNSKNIQVFEDGLMSRDFVYIDDVVDSLVLVINKQTASGEVYNVGSGERVTVLTVAETLKKLHNSDIQIEVTGEKLQGDIRHNFADITKIKQIGYLPKVNFNEGILRFVEWINQNSIIECNGYEDSVNELRGNGILK
jgi:dTDP-L-rhamnose 4-epimerase